MHVSGEEIRLQGWAWQPALRVLPPAPPLLLTATLAAPLHRKEWSPVFGGGSLPHPA